MKKYTFEVDITGRANVIVLASDLERACEIFKKGGDCETRLLEWDIETPYRFETYDNYDVKFYLLSEE